MENILIEVKIKYNHDLKEKLVTLLGVNNLIDYKIIKKSIDARKKSNICINYKIIASVYDKLSYPTINENFEEVSYKVSSNNLPVVIIGAGPAGLFCALKLLLANVKVILIDRGKGILERVRDVNLFREKGILNEESNVSFGLGGAGTFSDGKLNSGISNKNIKFVLNYFHKFGACENILYDSMPHIGSDYLLKVVDNMLNELKNLGCEILFSHKLVDLKIKSNKISSVILENNESLKEIFCENLVLATGHACFDTFKMYKKYLEITPKPFSMGVRIEHKQSLIDKIQYGKEIKQLGPATYKINTKINNRGVYSFCMCPGGEVIISSESKNKIVVNGMSNQKRDKENANSALLVDVLVTDFYKNDILDGFIFREKYEKLAYNISNSYLAPVQKLEDFLKDIKTTRLGKVTPSVRPGYVFANLKDCLPDFIYECLKKSFVEFDKKMHGFLDNDAILTAIETRSSSPVRVLRDIYLESNIKNIYPCGEGMGYAGGITSACCDGIKVADQIIKKLINKL